MSEPQVTYSPRPDATPEAERSALVAAYALLIQKHKERKEGNPAIAVPGDAAKAETQEGGEVCRGTTQ